MLILDEGTRSSYNLSAGNKYAPEPRTGPNKRAQKTLQYDPLAEAEIIATK